MPFVDAFLKHLPTCSECKAGDELQKLKQSFGQIAETRRTADGVVMKSLRFDSGKSTIAPQYRAILNRVEGVLMALKGYSIYVYGYTEQRVLANPSCLFAIAMPKRERPIAEWRSALSTRPWYPASSRPRK